MNFPTLIFALYAALAVLPFPYVPPTTECVVQHAWEDQSKIVSCGTTSYIYDPDGNDPPAYVGYDGPRWSAGWYRCTDFYCTTVDHDAAMPVEVLEP